MNKTVIAAFLCLCVFVGTAQSSTRPNSIVWDVNNLKSIGGHKTIVLGSPAVIDTDQGKAVLFDGVDDVLIVDDLPLAGAEKFTVEIIMRPDANAYDTEQKFLHAQENGTKNRIILLVGGKDKKQWYFDSFVKTGAGTQNLWDSSKTHPVGGWYNAAIVCDGNRLGQYVNGTLELSGKLDLAPFGKGKVSIGAKMNKKSYFKGAIRKIRFTPRPLKPTEFLKVEKPPKNRPKAG